MTVTKVGGANMIAHAQWPQCPPFPRVAVFYVTPAKGIYFPRGNKSFYAKTKLPILFV